MIDPRLLRGQSAACQHLNFAYVEDYCVREVGLQYMESVLHGERL